MLRQRKLYAILFALFIFVSGVFSPVMIAKNTSGIPFGQNMAIAQTTPESESIENDASSLPLGEATLPGCGVTSWNKVFGCIANFLYYVPFYISHILVSITAEIFDWAMFHSIEDTMYKIPFVTNGWVIVRDLANMAFIFVLLYIAIQTIIGIGHGTKKAIVTLVIMALLINFSMFLSKVVIDAGNILAHAFYNSIPPDPTIPVNDQRSVTKSLVAKMNPQRLMGPEVLRVEVDQTTTIEDAGCAALFAGQTLASPLVSLFTLPANVTTYNACIDLMSQNNSVQYVFNEENTGYFILVTILATIVNCVLIGVFLSVTFMLIGRIIGLIFAIIVSPLAFISKVIPGFSGMAYIGFDKWIKDLVGLSFLPGVFLFFMYLIIKFLGEPNNSVINNLSGLDAILAIMIPILFITVLIIISKKIAKSLAGEVGGMVGNAAEKLTIAGAGLALGGASLAVGGVGRLAGKGMQQVANSDAAQNHKTYETAQAAWIAGGRVGPAPVNPNTGFNRFVGSWGARMNERQEKIDHKEHAVHDLNAKSKEMYHGQEYKDLGRIQKEEVKKKLVEEKQDKYLNQEARKITIAGPAGRDYKDLTIAEKTYARSMAKAFAQNKVDHMETDSKEKLGKEKFLTSMRTGTWDPRNLSQVKSNEGVLAKIGAGLLATSANYTRLILKQGFGVEHGVGQKDFLKDLETTIKTGFTEGFKAFKLKVDLPKSGGHDDHGHDDHGGGGHH